MVKFYADVQETYILITGKISMNNTRIVQNFM